MSTPVIVGAVRTAIGRSFKGTLVNTPPETLITTVLPEVLKPGGVAAIITFHSGEDRRVKHAFRDCQRAGIYAADGRDPIIAREAEQRLNPRSRSAKLRWARMPGA